MIGSVYFILNAELRAVKIGYAQNAKSRLSELQVSSPDKLELVASVAGTKSDEAAMHRALSDRKRSGEWFRWDFVTHEIMERAKAGVPIDGLIAWAEKTSGLTAKQIEEALA